MSNLSLNFTLPVGAKIGAQTVKDVSLLRVNGVAEEVFTTRLPDRPYTWMGYVIAVSLDAFGSSRLAADCRDQYLKNEAIKLPVEVLSLPLSEVNTLLVEIHRRIWKSVIKDQECSCKYCGTTMLTDIDLTRLAFSDKDLEKIENLEDPFTLKTTLPVGWRYVAPRLPQGQESPLAQYDNLVFDTFIFRTPTLGDAIKNEKSAKDNIKFWRQIAYDCLIEVVASEANVSLPDSAYRPMGLKLYNNVLDGEDLRVIRETLRDSIPVLPLFYEETCPSCKRLTPVIMEQTSFFSE